MTKQNPASLPGGLRPRSDKVNKEKGKEAEVHLGPGEAVDKAAETSRAKEKTRAAKRKILREKDRK